MYAQSARQFFMIALAQLVVKKPENLKTKDFKLLKIKK